MLDEPDVPHALLLATLQDAFDISATGVTFLPLGADRRSFSYRVDTADAQRFFLKLRSEPPAPAVLAVPRALRDVGIAQVVAPLPTRTGALSARLDGYTVLLYPFVSGDAAMTRGMSPAQWRVHGSVLRRVHDNRT